jgi:hypothetical protein
LTPTRQLLTSTCTVPVPVVSSVTKRSWPLPRVQGEKTLGPPYSPPPQPSAGPPGWKAALALANSEGHPARASVGHFGGSIATNGWTKEFASYMGEPKGTGFYADLAYWNELECVDPNAKECQASVGNLTAALTLPNVSKRVM